MPRKKVLDLPPEVRAFFSAASARRQRVDKVCEQCGTPMPGALRAKRYCSNACTIRAYRKRQRAQGTAPSGGTE